MPNGNLSEKRFSLSLGTKYILFTIVMGLTLMLGGTYTAYLFITEQKIQFAQSNLASQVNLLAKTYETERGKVDYDFNRLELNEKVSFQIVNLNGIVEWDSHNPARVRSQLVGPQPLFDAAKSESTIRKNMLFVRNGSNETYLGSYRRVNNEYVVMGAIAQKLIFEDTFYILEKLLYLGSMLSGLALIAVVFFSYRIVMPLRALTSAARRIADGHFDIQIKEVNSQDEIGTLSRTFVTMAERIKVLLQEEFHKVRISAEMHDAAQIQSSLLPEPSVSNDRYEIQSYYQSAAETGGDFWGFFETKDYLVTYIADATGHGLTSAMLTVAARSCFATLNRLVEKEHFTPDPGQFLKFANDSVIASAQEELNMTMFVAVYCYEDRTVSYANAGHNPAWIVRNSKEITSIEVLKSSGVRLGETKDYPAPEVRRVTLNPDDILFLYTDGVIDCEGEDSKVYGKNRLKDLLTEKVQSGMRLEQVRNEVVTDLSDFLNDRPVVDDVTFALVRPK